MPEGLYRDGDWAQVSDGGKHSIPIPRAQYEEKGYQPPFYELLEKEQFDLHAKGVSFD